MRTRLLIPFLLIIPTLFAQPQKKISSYVRDENRQVSWLNEYGAFLSIPNVYGDSVNIYKNADAIAAMLRARGIQSQLLYAGVKGSSPVVYGEVKTPGATRTLTFYAHYDGQPVNPKQWADGLAPFTPALFTDRLDKGGKPLPFPVTNTPAATARLYARGSADDKAGVFAIIAAYETLVKSGVPAGVNIKFFFEGEEEAGSVNLQRIFLKYKNLLASDLWIICDGPRHPSGKKQVVFGVRGDVNVDLTVYASKRPLHSGNYGNWAPNAAMRLVQLLSTMKDENGMVLIPGWYDDVAPLSEIEKQALQAIPDVESILKEDLLLNKPDGNGKSFKELLTVPTLNINGIQSANVGSMASNIIPAEATAVLDLRVVKGNDIDRQIAKLRSHIESKGYYVIDRAPTDEERRNHPMIAKLIKRNGGYNAQRTPMDLPIAQQVVKAMQSTVDYPIIKIPSVGGSLPLFMFEKELQTQPITVPIVNYDNNQHAENENLLVQYLWDGIETMAILMASKP